MPTSTATVEVKARPETIWSVISDGPRLPEWLTPVKALEERPPSPLAAKSQFHVVIGRLGGAKMRITEATPNRRLAWKAGPPLAHMMGMPMSVSVDLTPTSEGTTRVTFTIKSAMMMVPMMKMMAALSTKEEVPKTAQAIKRLVEGDGASR